MAEVAGNTNRVKILAGSVAMAGAGSPTGAYILGVDNTSFGKLCDMLDITSFGDTNKKRLAGLKDTTVKISGNVYVGDTTGQDVIIPGNTVMIGVYPSGPSVAGSQVNAIVESMETTADASGKQTFTASFSCIAAPVALPLIS
jgi:hypothetical protein